YEVNNKSVNPETGKFINQPEYNAKWLPFLELVNEYVNINVEQTFWGSTWIGGLRFPNFFKGVNVWGTWAQEAFEVVMAKIPVEYSMDNVVTEFRASTPEFTLPTLVVKANATFLGWYDNPEFAGEAITKVVPKNVEEDLVLYAKWDEEEVEVVPTVAEVRAAELNEVVTTVGVVTVKIGNNAFIQDETAGIYVYVDGDSELGSELGEKLVVGNKVKVTGKRADFNKLVQISNVTEIEVLATDV